MVEDILIHLFETFGLVEEFRIGIIGGLLVGVRFVLFG